MKNAFVTIVAILLAMPAASMAAGGSDVGNGGDAYALEFTGIGQSLADHWDQFDLSFGLQVSKDRFTEAVRITEVHSVEQALYVGKSEVDAKNWSGARKILFNRNRWDALRADKIRAVALVLHEYLGVMGAEGRRFDDFYERTGKVLAKLRSVLEKQSRIQVNFSCWVEAWNSEKNRIAIVESIDTYVSPMPEVFFTPERGSQLLRVSLRKIGGDYLAPALMARLSFELHQVTPGMLPSEKDLLVKGQIDFGSQGKKSLRIWGSPDLQLTCFRAFDGVEN